MKFLSNIYNPKLKDTITRRTGETQEQAQQRHKKWLAGKIIGEPQATEKYTVADLKAMNYVGVYSESQPGD